MWKQRKTIQPCTCPAVKIRTSSQTEGEACVFKNNFAEITYWISLHEERFQKSDHPPPPNAYFSLHEVRSIGPLITFFSLAAMMVHLFK